MQQQQLQNQVAFPSQLPHQQLQQEKKHDFYILLQGIIEQDQFIEASWKVYSLETKDFIHSDHTFISKKNQTIKPEILKKLNIDQQQYSQNSVTFKDFMKKLSNYINENIVEKEKQFLFILSEEKLFTEYLPKHAETNWISLEPYYYTFIDIRLEFYEFFVQSESQKDMVIVDNEVQGFKSKVTQIKSKQKSIFQNINNLAEYFGLLQIQQQNITQCQRQLDYLIKLLFLLLKTKYKFSKQVGNPLVANMPKVPLKNVQDNQSIANQQNNNVQQDKQLNQQEQLKSQQQQNLEKQQNYQNKYSQQQTTITSQVNNFNFQQPIQQKQQDNKYKSSSKSSSSSSSSSRSRSRSRSYSSQSKKYGKFSSDKNFKKQESYLYDQQKLNQYGICHLSGLSSSTNKLDIYDFFDKYKILDKGVFLDLDRNAGYAVFQSKQEAQSAKDNLNNKSIFRKPVSIEIISQDQFMDFKEIFDKKMKKQEEYQKKSKFTSSYDNYDRGYSPKKEDKYQKYDSSKDKYFKNDRKYESSKYDNRVSYSNKYDNSKYSRGSRDYKDYKDMGGKKYPQQQYSSSGSGYGKNKYKKSYEYH